MPTFDATRAEILVFTYKDGLLSAVAHDLKLRVGEFSLAIDPAAAPGGGAGGVASVRLTVSPRSLRVVCARKKGHDNHGALSPDDKRQVEENTDREVLEVARYPELAFVSTAVTELGAGQRYRVRGELALHGVSRSVEAMVRSQGQSWVAELTLQQPDFRIKPFSALLGSMKIKPQVDVTVRVPKW